MNDSPTRYAGGSHPRRSHTTANELLEELYGLGTSDLACCTAVALLAAELCGGGRCRVESAGDRSVPDGFESLSLRGPGPPATTEARLALEGPDGEPDTPRPDELALLATCAGLVLERHRLAREARSANLAAQEARAILKHTLRGHLHTALLRSDNFLVGIERGGADLGDMKTRLEELKETVWKMVQEIEQLVDEPGVGERGPTEAVGERVEPVPVPALLERARAAAGADQDSPHVEVVDRVPPVRVDAGRLVSALGELFDLAGRARGQPTLTVRSDDATSTVRVSLSLELGPLPSSTAPDDGAPDGGGSGRSLPALRDRVGELGGRLRIEAGGEKPVEVVLTLPAGERPDRDASPAVDD